MKNKQTHSILILCFLLTSSLTYAGPWEELNGRAAADRTREARNRTKAVRAQVTQQRQANAAMRVQVAAASAKIQAFIQAGQKRTEELKSLVATRTDDVIQQQSMFQALVNQLQLKHQSIVDLKTKFTDFYEKTLGVVQRVEAADLLREALDESQIGLLSFLGSYKKMRGELSDSERQVLDDVVFDLTKEGLQYKSGSRKIIKKATDEFLIGLSIGKLTKAMSLVVELEQRAQSQVDLAVSISSSLDAIQDSYAGINSTLSSGVN